jgi:hypothetical protein
MKKTEDHEVKYLGRVELFLLLRDKPRGHFISYDELADVLGRDPQSKGRTDILWVRNRLIKEHGKWLENEVGKGYFLALSNEHAGASQRYDDQASRKQRLAVDIAVNTDVEELSEDERRSHREIQKKVAIKYLVMKKIDKAKPPELDAVSMPSGQELLEIYRSKRT